jgi:hypothetical protein
MVPTGDPWTRSSVRAFAPGVWSLGQVAGFRVSAELDRPGCDHVARETPDGERLPPRRATLPRRRTTLTSLWSLRNTLGRYQVGVAWWHVHRVIPQLAVNARGVR